MYSHILFIILLLIFILFLLFFIKHTLKKQKQITVMKYIKHKECRKKEQKQTIQHPPEILKLHQLLHMFKNDPQNNWAILLEMANIYHKGSYPNFKPNTDVALMCYSVAATCPHPDVAGTAQSKYIEARTQSIDSNDIAGDHLPTSYANELCYLAKNVIANTPYKQFHKPHVAQIKHNVNPPNIRDIVDNDQEIIIYTPTPPQTFVPIFLTDSQNVHDHSVMNTMKHNIDTLQHNTTKPYNHNIIEENVRNVILEQDDISSEDKMDALMVLERLSDKQHSTLNISEKDALGLIWDKINKCESSKTKHDAKEMLVRQLASGVEKGSVVCSTGRISRILGTFDGIDDTLKDNKPMWAIKQELANLAGKTREDYIKNMSESDRIAYNNGQNDKATEQMIHEYRKNVKEEYVDKLGLSEAIIEPIIEINTLGF